MTGRRGRIKVLQSRAVTGAHMFWGWLYPCFTLFWGFFVDIEHKYQLPQLID